MRLFITGVDARYQLIYEPTTSLKVGTGLSFISLSHTYRDLLAVDFTNTYQLLSRGETFTTANRTAVGAPLYLELETKLSQTVSIGLLGRAQLHVNNEDKFWSTGLRLGFRM